ncbi:MAG: hypothetical protein JW950_02185 [Deltaproteobacteria bacterium]|nr:hypothetical protein [Deltaproteobacteria bacterium]
MKEINYVVNMGRRCNCTGFLRTYGLGRFNSPFEWMYCDYETAIINITSDFKDYTNDVVLFNNRSNDFRLFNAKNTSRVDRFFTELSKQDLHYMGQDYTGVTLKMSQNYLPTRMDGDIHSWDRLCIFHHIDIHTSEGLAKMRRRIERFMNIRDKNTLLIYLTQIITDIEKMERYYVDVAEKNHFCLPVAIIFCTSEPIEETYLKKFKNLYVIYKQVPPSEYQARLGFYSDNDAGVLDFDDVYAILLKEFQFILMDAPGQEMKPSGISFAAGYDRERPAAP